MYRKGLEHSFEKFKILSQRDIKKIHEATMKIMEEKGIIIRDEAMRQLLVDNGCTAKGEVVYFTEQVVMDALGLCRRSYTIKAIDKTNNIEFSPGRRTYFFNSCGHLLLDLENGGMREPTRKEFYDYLRIIDNLENIDIQNCFPMFGFKNVPNCMRLLESAAAKFRVSTKAQCEGAVGDEYKYIIKMGKLLDADVLQLVNSEAPLCYFEESISKIRYFAENDAPFHFAPGPFRGMSAPVSIAGVLAVNNADSLAGIVMAQLVKPGSRVWVNSMILMPNMSSGAPAFGDISNATCDVAFNQMWEFYGVPTWCNSCAWTSSNKIDYQAAYESSTAMLMCALSGGSALSFQGGLHAELSVHPIKAIIDDDIVGMVKCAAEGIIVDDETLALDDIMEGDHFNKSYLDTDYTLFNWKNETYLPKVADRTSYQIWIENQTDIIGNAKRRMETILENNKVEINQDIENIIEGVLKEARDHYRSIGKISNEEWELYQKDLNSLDYPFA